MIPRDLRLLVLHVSTRCDQSCGHCSIWRTKGSGEKELGLEERLAIVREAHSLGARSVLFTGGEPLLCDHLEALAGAAHGLGLSVQIASNGLGLARAGAWLGDLVDEIYVSLEGPEAIHDSVRGPRMFSRLLASVAAVRALPRRPRLVGRSVISARNAAVLDQTVEAARSLGLDGVSFLPIDVTSGAFGGEPGARAALRPGPGEMDGLRRAIAALEARGELGSFVREDARKLARMSDAFSEVSRPEAPACDAPEWSSVVEADGRVRPCFFQAPVGRLEASVSLAAVRQSSEYLTALDGLGRGNPTCARCVCPKRLATGVASVSTRMSAALGRAMPRWFPRVGASA